MSVRLTWTNNSAGHDGTRIYRDTAPMDPQALPAPIAVIAPVANGQSAEYIDGTVTSGQHYYLVQDYSGVTDSVVSDEVSVDLGTDLNSINIGDEVEGGIYAGTITYADAREFHIIFAKQTGESPVSLRWGVSGQDEGADDPDDGAANSAAVLAIGESATYEVVQYCADYIDAEGYDDWYTPSRNELALEVGLRGHPEFSTDTGYYRWSSTETPDDGAWRRDFSDNELGGTSKDPSPVRVVRPIRRVAV